MSADGQLTQVGDQWQLRYTRALPHRPEKVWRALTEDEHLAAWFPHDIVGDRVAGAPLKFVSRDAGDPSFEGEMLTVDPPRLLEFLWGTDRLRFELEPDGDGTVLTLTDTFAELGKAARDGAGWHVYLEQLEYSLVGEPLPWKPESRWRAVHPAYVERLGTDASTMGPPEGHPVTQE